VNNKSDPFDIQKIAAFIHLDKQTGDLFWIKRKASDFKCDPKSVTKVMNQWNTRYDGKPALSGIDKTDGYKKGSFLGKRLKAHRVVFALAHGRWPDGQVDHINGDKADNRIENLREASNAENQWNKGPCPFNKSGIKGVSCRESTGTWQAEIHVNKKRFYLGCFSTAEQAHEAYRKASKKYHKEFSRME